MSDLKAQRSDRGIGQNGKIKTVVVVSTVSDWASCVARGEKDDEFFKKLDELNMRKLLICIIWPSTDVTPESLGTLYDGGINAAEGTAEFLMKARVDRAGR